MRDVIAGPTCKDLVQGATSVHVFLKVVCVSTIQVSTHELCLQITVHLKKPIVFLTKIKIRTSQLRISIASISTFSVYLKRFDIIFK